MKYLSVARRYVLAWRAGSVRSPHGWRMLLRLARVGHYLLLAASLFLVGGSATAAKVAESEYSALLTEANRSGAAFVTVTVTSVTLTEAAGGDLTKIVLLRDNERRLERELGAQAWEFGRTNNHMGQVGLFVTPAGLQILKATKSAESFFGSVHPRLQAHRTRPEFLELESALDANVTVGAVVRLRNEAAQIDIDRNGSLKVTGGLASVSEHTARATRLFDSLRPEDVPDLQQAKSQLRTTVSQSTLKSLEVPIRLNRRALLAAAVSSDVAAIRLQGDRPIVNPIVHSQLMEEARRFGSVHVLLLLRDPSQQAEMSSSELARATAAKQRVMTDVLSAHDIRSPLRDMSAVGVFSGVLTLSELQRLVSGKDPRLLGIDLNRLVAEPALNRSIPRMQMSSVWNTGYRGAYVPPNSPAGTPASRVKIAVFDTGVSMTHPMLQNKLVRSGFEACFGVNSNISARRSVCLGAPLPNPSPGQGWTYNSFYASGQAGDGSPPSAYCPENTTAYSDCDHGTLVATIAAGSSITLNTLLPNLPDLPPLTLSGVAPEAYVVPVQMASWAISPQQTSTPPGFFAESILGALNTIISLIQDPDAYPQDKLDWVINISIASGELYSSPCDNVGMPNTGLIAGPNPPTGAKFVDALQLLKGFGIPVIVAAGNNNAPNELTWPACLSHAIKASSIINQAGSTHTVSQTDSNKIPVGPNTPFYGQEFYVASGGGRLINGSPGKEKVFAGTQAAIVGNRYYGVVGTSFAAPHVAGAYAVIMAGYKKLGLPWSVDAGSQYLRGTASTDAIWTDPTNNSITRTYRSPQFIPVP